MQQPKVGNSCFATLLDVRLLTHRVLLQEANIMSTQTWLLAQVHLATDISSSAFREHLLSSQQGQPTLVSIACSHDGMHAASPHDHHIDRAIAGPGYPMPISESGAEEQAHEVRKERRELSTSKRAAKNRAPQVRCPIETPMASAS